LRRLQYASIESVKRTHISLDYNFGIKDTIVKQRYHTLEVKFDKIFIENRHGSSINWYGGTEIGLNTDRFLIAPKLGGSMSYEPLAFGTEFVYYLNFEENTFQIIPFVGLELHHLRFAIHPHVSLTNKNFNPVNTLHLNLTYRLLKLKEETDVYLH